MNSGMDQFESRSRLLHDSVWYFSASGWLLQTSGGKEHDVTTTHKERAQPFFVKCWTTKDCTVTTEYTDDEQTLRESPGHPLWHIVLRSLKNTILLPLTVYMATCACINIQKQIQCHPVQTLLLQGACRTSSNSHLQSKQTRRGHLFPVMAILSIGPHWGSFHVNINNNMTWDPWVGCLCSPGDEMMEALIATSCSLVFKVLRLSCPRPKRTTQITTNKQTEVSQTKLLSNRENRPSVMNNIITSSCISTLRHCLPKEVFRYGNHNFLTVISPVKSSQLLIKWNWTRKRSKNDCHFQT